MTIIASAPRQEHSSSAVTRPPNHWPRSAKPEAIPDSLRTAINKSGAHAILFGRFRLILHRRELLADEVPMPIGDRALDVLLALIEAHGELVTKDELLSRVWPNTIVEENSLQFQISTLRKLLGTCRDFIKTVSGRGYRFTAEVTIVGPETDAVEGNSGFELGATSVVQLREPPNNLAVPTSELIGRETHLMDVADLVAANRLVTLVGTGGMGKTRLAVELARRMLPQFNDGVRFVELGSVSDSTLVPIAIATALGLSDGVRTLEGLAAALASKHLLLVLDNCEHLIDSVASITEALLHASASLHVVATSREPLRAEGEQVYRVLPLDVPPESTETIEELLQHSAAKLFISRAHAAEPSLPLDGRVVAATVEICRHLDGMPLAIEFAAAHAAAFGVEELASRLDERLSLLTDGRRTAPARHQTLRAALDWSYQLLHEPERVVMRRLSIFDGAFTMEQAITAAAGGEIAPSDVVHFLASLVAKSLVASDVSAGVPRYRLLETTRAYAMEKLSECGEFGTVIGPHTEPIQDCAGCIEIGCGV